MHRRRAADAADAVIATPGDRAPAASQRKDRAVHVFERPQPATQEHARPSPRRTADGRTHGPISMVHIKARARAARGGCRGRARRGHSGGKACRWRARRTRRPESTPRSRRVRRVLQSHRKRTSITSCGRCVGRCCSRYWRGAGAVPASSTRSSCTRTLAAATATTTSRYRLMPAAIAALAAAVVTRRRVDHRAALLLVDHRVVLRVERVRGLGRDGAATAGARSWLCSSRGRSRGLPTEQIRPSPGAMESVCASAHTCAAERRLTLMGPRGW